MVINVILCKTTEIYFITLVTTIVQVCGEQDIGKALPILRLALLPAGKHTTDLR